VGVSHCLSILCLLLIGTLIGFSGKVLTDRFQLECLTECFPLHTNVYEKAMITRLARAFGALRIAIDQLHKHYENLKSMNLVELQTPERDFRVTFPHPNSYEAEGRKIEFTYNSRFNDTKLIFVATTTEGTKILVKFTRQYSEDAHRICATVRVAPKSTWISVSEGRMVYGCYGVSGPRNLPRFGA
jgi:hypothetical protein